jgi:hypothetical protein
MNERNQNNQFKFGLYQEDILLCERCFNADEFNPFTRYSIDIREILPSIITKLQKALSKKRYDVEFPVGKDENIDLLEYYKSMVDMYKREWRNGIRYNPRVKQHQIEDKTIRGVECKIGFYINENPIVERIFFVDGFNPVARQSYDIYNEVWYASDRIFKHIKNNDVKNMWDDYDLINRRNMSITQIRELSPDKRRRILKSINSD